MAVLALCAAPQAAGAEVALDATFGAGGTLAIGIGNGHEDARAMAALPDGRILVAGAAHNGHGYDFALLRYRAAGILDATFGSGGKVTTAFDQGDARAHDRANALALQPDGKIVLAGYAGYAGFQNVNGGRLALARYLPDGALDASFGTGGKVATEVAGWFARVHAVAVQADGRIVVAGATDDGAIAGDIALARYLPDGTLDASFGSAGLVVTSLGIYQDAASALLLQADGRIVVAGYANSFAKLNVALLRYLPDGSLDASFGAGGVAQLAIGASHDRAHALAAQADGKLVVGATTETPLADYSSRFALARFSRDGALDTAFGTGGVAITSVSDSAHQKLSALAVASDGALFAAGHTGTPDGRDIVVTRYDANGALDSAFGAGGIARTRIAAAAGPSAGEAWALAVQADGTLLVAGQASNPWNTDFALARYRADGTLDPAFGTQGLALTDGILESRWAQFRAVRVQADGRIVAGGATFNGSDQDFALARFNADGTPDGSFATGGKLAEALGGPHDVINAIALQPDGKVVTAGHAGNQMALARYDGAGLPDTSFGSAGKVLLSIRGIRDGANAVVLQPDGKILVGGYSVAEGPSYQGHLALARYQPDGTLDASFGVGGTVTTALTASSGDAQIFQGKALLLQPDGRIVMAGIHYAEGASGYHFTLARYLANGTLDADFGTGGVVTTPIGHASCPYALALQPDGRLIAAGPYTSVEGGGVALARYHANGTLDGSFGAGGIVTIADMTEAYALALRADGTLLAAGVAPASAGGGFALLAFRPDGSLHTGFMMGGRIATRISVPPFADVAQAIALQPDGAIVLAGSAGQLGAALARYAVSGAGGLPDTAAPSAPGGLAGIAYSDSGIRLAWSAAEDNVAVTVYQVFRDGVLRATVAAPATGFTDSGLAATAAYLYTVAACDAAGNCSAQGAAASATTLAAGISGVVPELAQSWNLLGNGLALPLAVPAFLGEAGAAVVSVWKWDAPAQQWAFYSPLLSAEDNVAYAESHGYLALASIGPGEGYWVNAEQPGALPPQSGSAFALDAAGFAALPAQWNLRALHAASPPSPSAFHAGMQTGEPAAFVSLWQWDAERAKWWFYSPLLEASGGLAAVRTYAEQHGYLDFETVYPPRNAAKRLGPGEGFWINK